MAYPVDAIVGPIDILKLPAAGSDGQYIKTVDGKPTWVMETPQGIVTETGANVANTIGADTSASIPEKVTNFVLEATTSVKGKLALASSEDIITGVDETKAITPKHLYDAYTNGYFKYGIEIESGLPSSEFDEIIECGSPDATASIIINGGYYGD